MSHPHAGRSMQVAQDFAIGFTPEGEPIVTLRPGQAQPDPLAVMQAVDGSREEDLRAVAFKTAWREAAQRPKEGSILVPQRGPLVVPR